MVENVRQLLPVGYATDSQLCHYQNARVRRYDIHLVGDQFSANVVGSSASDQTESVEAAGRSGAIRDYDRRMGDDGRGKCARVRNGGSAH